MFFYYYVISQFIDDAEQLWLQYPEVVIYVFPLNNNRESSSVEAVGLLVMLNIAGPHVEWPLADAIDDVEFNYFIDDDSCVTMIELDTQNT